MGVSSLPVERIRPGVSALAQVMRELADPSLDRLDLRRPTWLSGAEIEATMSGATLLCRTVYGDPYSVEVRPDGTLIGKAGYAHEDCDEGEWWVEDERWCRRWNVWSYGETARFFTVVEGDQIKWYKDDLVLFNRGVLVPAVRVEAGAAPAA
jgi:GntR family transcriptional regulator/MocR family aminotransferase